MKILIIILLLTLGSAHAEDREWTDFGNLSNADFLEMYIDAPDQTDLGDLISVWIDGWMDGVFSTYAYEGILNETALNQLYACRDEFTPGFIRRRLLQLGADDFWEEKLTSNTMYWMLRFKCEHVLGTIEQAKPEGDES